MYCDRQPGTNQTGQYCRILLARTGYCGQLMEVYMRLDDRHNAVTGSLGHQRVQSNEDTIIICKKKIHMKL